MMNYFITLIFRLPIMFFMIDGVESDASKFIPNFTNWTSLQQASLTLLIGVLTVICLNLSEKMFNKKES